MNTHVDTHVAYLPIVRDTRKIIIDADLHHILRRCRWCIPKNTRTTTKGIRPYTNIKMRDGSRRHVILARWIAKPPYGKFVKHLNYDMLDCRRVNLELVPNKEDAGPRNVHREYGQGKITTQTYMELTKYLWPVQHQSRWLPIHSVNPNVCPFSNH